MPEEPADVIALADTISEVLYGVAGWLLVIVGLVIGSIGAIMPIVEFGVRIRPILFSTVLLGIGLVAILGGIFVNPRFRRLDRRHARSTFGTVRTVDQRTIRPEEECWHRCVTCDERVDRGMVRRFREEYAAFGVPVYTRSVDHNHYCLECALEELYGPRAVNTEGKITERDDPEQLRTGTEPSLERE